MPTDYTPFYYKDLVSMINSLALDSMKDPVSMMLKPERSDLLMYHNASVAIYNRGIMKLREALLAELRKGDAKDD